MTTLKTKCFYAMVAALVCAAIVSCGSFTGPETATALEPQPLENIRTSRSQAAAGKKRPIVALVLGGGGLRGFAHVGVLRALDEAGIKPDIVVGTSAGAVVGAAYASGLTWSQIDDAGRAVDLSSLVDLTASSSGIIRGGSLARWIDSITRQVPIERFPIRFAAVATDLKSQQMVVLDKGYPGTAVQASSAVPGINVPVAYSGGHLIDGGVTSLIPVRTAKAMGADFVIAVDIYCNEPFAGSTAAPSVISQVMRSQSCLIAQQEKVGADILISPSVGTLKISDKRQQIRAVEAGYRAARAALPSGKMGLTSRSRLSRHST